MGFQITTLMENEFPKDCFAAEHGLSLLIETDGFRMLYDTGASSGFLSNARSMKKTWRIWTPGSSATAITIIPAVLLSCSCRLISLGGLSWGALF